MPEHRARKHHQDRVAETLRLEIGTMIEGELVDPASRLLCREVALNPGGKSARVYVAVDQRVKDIVKAEADTIAGLEAAKGYIRYEFKERMGVRHVPDLAFLADRSGRFQARIVELMDRSRNVKKRLPQSSPRARTKGSGGAAAHDCPCLESGVRSAADTAHPKQWCRILENCARESGSSSVPTPVPTATRSAACWPWACCLSSWASMSI